ncbi:hypothetical protein GF371_00140 [Candidatus Woesearchaeota archaeon]|nr:hypothetical protein [Candidatus Woesearchaeota archaeon]
MAKPLNILIYSLDSTVKDVLAEQLSATLTSQGHPSPDISRAVGWQSATRKVLNLPVDMVFFETPKGETHSLGDAADAIKRLKKHIYAVALISPESNISEGDLFTNLGLDGTIAISPETPGKEGLEEQISQLISQREEWEHIAATVLQKLKGNNTYLGKEVLPSLEEKRVLADGRRIKHISEVNIYYLTEDGKESSVKVLRKFTDPDGEEMDLYKEFIGSEASKCFVPFFGNIDSENAVVLANWNSQKGRLGDNTLEQRLKKLYFRIKDAREKEEDAESIDRERRAHLYEITRLVAHFHYFATKKINDDIRGGTESILSDGGKSLSSQKGLRLLQKSHYYEKFLCDTRRVISYINNKVPEADRLNRREIDSAMQELKILLAQNDSFFDWATVGPLTVIHNDLYGENILHNEDFSADADAEVLERQFKDRLIDLRHMAFGPSILDFGFLESPWLYYSEEHLNHIEDIKYDCFKLWKDEIRKLFVADGTKPASIMEILDSNQEIDMFDIIYERPKVIYWHMKIAADISKSKRDNDLYTQLNFSKRTMGQMLKSKRNIPYEEILEKLSTFFDKHIYSKMGLLNGETTGDS